MTQKSALEQARQANPDAIAALINSNTKPQGISVKVYKKDQQLIIRAESAQMIDKDKFSKLIQSGLNKIGVTGMRTARVEGYQSGIDVVIWHDDFTLESFQKGDFQISQTTELSLNESEVELENTEKEDQSNSEKIRNGSVKGIVLLVKNALDKDKVLVESQMQFGLTLWLRLKSTEDLNADDCIRKILKVLNENKPTNITSVRVSEISRTDEKKQIWDKFIYNKDGSFVDGTKASLQIVSGLMALLILGFVSCSVLTPRPKPGQVTSSTASTIQRPISQCVPASGRIWTNVRLYRDASCQSPFATVLGGSGSSVAIRFDTGETEVKTRDSVKFQSYVMTNDPAISRQLFSPM